MRLLCLLINYSACLTLSGQTIPEITLLPHLKLEACVTSVPPNLEDFRITRSSFQDGFCFPERVIGISQDVATKYAEAHLSPNQYSSTEVAVERVSLFSNSREIQLAFRPERIGELLFLQLYTSNGQRIQRLRTTVFPTLTLNLPTNSGAMRILLLTLQYADGKRQTHQVIQY